MAIQPGLIALQVVVVGMQARGAEMSERLETLKKALERMIQDALNRAISGEELVSPRN